MDSTKHYGCFSEGSNPSGTTIYVCGVTVACGSPKPLVRVQILADVQNGIIAQLVEQWTENPCVTGSIPVNTTTEDWLSGLKRHPAKVLYPQGYRRFESFIFRNLWLTDVKFMAQNT